MKHSMLCLGFVALVLTGCMAEEFPAPPPVSPDEFAQEHQEWRENRRERLVRPFSGVALWMGLWQLAQGATPFGSDPELPIVLPKEDSPALAGTIHRSGQEVRLEPAAGSPLGVREGPVLTEMTLLESDRSGNTTNLALGSLGLRIHGEPGTDRLWLRVWDEDSSRRETFQLPESYPVDTAWRVTAKFEPYPEPRALPVQDVTNGMIEYQTPGELVFHVDGEEHSLIAVLQSETSSNYFVMLWDETANIDTYQAGRYLSVPVADEDGWTTINFNRTYNPPCVFSAYSVCALPPPENRLTFALTAGEKRPDEAAH
jgi:uncharacterized protein (DUF1684 family)